MIAKIRSKFCYNINENRIQTKNSIEINIMHTLSVYYFVGELCFNLLSPISEFLTRIHTIQLTDTLIIKYTYIVQTFNDLNLQLISWFVVSFAQR